MKGIIALDIDGTITAEHHLLPQKVQEYFQFLHREGWQFIFLTGRTFRWGFDVLKSLPFDYYFAVQNGALILAMPKQTILSKKYMGPDLFPTLEIICKEEPTDYVLYTGYEWNDVCYYRPQCFSEELLNYLELRIRTLKETWIPVQKFDAIANFASVKCFGEYASAKRICQRLEKDLNLEAPMIRDPFNSQYYVVQATPANINKGQALKDLIALKGYLGPIIAAGDDYNDQSMLVTADCKIVMETAPKEMHALADILAFSAANLGIIPALEKAIGKVQ